MESLRRKAEDNLAGLFREDGWSVEVEPSLNGFRPDLIVRKGAFHYVVELKSLPEGRPDRVLPLLSQAILQASRYAEKGHMSPLAVVRVSQASEALRRKVEKFRIEYAPNIPVGLVSESGESRFFGPGLESLNVEPAPGLSLQHIAKPRKASDLFSDLNQWMLKVLLAPELPNNLLNAPRNEYRSASGLAEAAQVSVMSASRFVRRLQEDGFLENSGRSIRLVRRGELFRRWQSSALRPSPELRMSYLIPAADSRQLRKVASQLDACISLFAAADMLQLGHVSGVSPHIYVRSLAGPWPGLVPARPGESPHVILKQPSASESVFRGAVRMDGVLVSDVLQIWLDVSVHPSRGAEQAELLRRKVLSNVLGDDV